MSRCLTPRTNTTVEMDYELRVQTISLLEEPGASCSMEGDTTTTGDSDVVTLLLRITVYKERPAELNVFHGDISDCRVLDPTGYRARTSSRRKVILECTSSGHVSDVESDPVTHSSVLDDHAYLYADTKSPVSGPGGPEQFLAHFVSESLSVPNQQQQQQQQQQQCTSGGVSFANAYLPLTDIEEGAPKVKPSEYPLQCVQEETMTLFEEPDVKFEPPTEVSSDTVKKMARSKRTKRHVSPESSSSEDGAYVTTPPSKMSKRKRCGSPHSGSGPNQKTSTYWGDFEMWSDPEFRRWSTFRCYLCSVKFSSANKLRKHILGQHQSETKPDTGESDYCMMIASFGKRLSAKSDQVKCILCDFKSVSFLDFRTHVSDHLTWQIGKVNHANLPVHTGKTGNATSTSPSGARKPTLSSGTLKAERVTIPEHYKDYIQQTESEQWTCKECGFTRPRLGNLKIHVRLCHLKQELGLPVPPQRRKPSSSSNARTFMCNVCGVQLRRLETLKQHLIVNHDQETGETYTCPKCDKSFKTLSQMTEHERRRHTTAQCSHPGCGVVLLKGNLKSHMETKHSRQRHVCETCQKTFGKKSHMMRHKKVKHEGLQTKKFICEWPGCGKTFASRWNLRVHGYRHTGEKPLQCDQCGYMARQKTALDYHCKTAHIKDGDPNETVVKAEKL